MTVLDKNHGAEVMQVLLWRQRADKGPVGWLVKLCMIGK